MSWGSHHRGCGLSFGHAVELVLWIHAGPEAESSLAMRICLIFNPAARGERASRWAPHLRQFERDCVLRPTEAPGAARALARSAVLEGFDTVVAAGGDGTVNEVLNGIAAVPGGLCQTRLGVLPMGTINVFARELGIPYEPSVAWRTILDGIERRVDLPLVKLSGCHGTETRHFIQLAGAGLDARAVELVSWRLKKKLGMAAYIFAAIQAYGGRTHTLKVESAGSTYSGEAVLVGNGQLYGGNHAVFYRAKQDDGLLDVCVLRRVTALMLAQASLAVLTGNWSKITGVDYVQTAEFKATGATRTPLELEGDSAGELPAAFRIAHYKARVLAPLHSLGARGRLGV